MDEQQRQALEQSIEHWRDNERRADQDLTMQSGAEHCACCRLQVLRTKGDFGDIDCNGCVIADYTGEQSCERTPYYRVTALEAPVEMMGDWLQELLDGEEPDLWAMPE